MVNKCPESALRGECDVLGRNTIEAARTMNTTELDIFTYVRGNAAELFLLTGYQAALGFIGYRFTKSTSKTLGLAIVFVCLSLYPVSVMISRHSAALRAQLTTLQSASLREVNASRIESAFVGIGEAYPTLNDAALTTYANCVDLIEGMTRGREPIPDETAYFRVLTEELNKCGEGDVVWDIVMPLNPTRVGGRRPLDKYLEAISHAVATNGVKYRLVVMASQVEGEATPQLTEAFERLTQMGVELYVVSRGLLPDNLRGNFSVYPHRIACEAQRGDDALIMGGHRLLGQSD